ncbi:MAG: MaoC family dehydratase [Candidatus Dormiibacterota bacterium]
MAVAVGLGSIDMPVPSVVEWEWLNWKFPRAVHAGDTIYARWTLTQKRPPIGGAPTSIVVWRVDVHTADGALCAEGEVGAKVTRRKAASGTRSATATDGPGPAEPAAAAPAAAPRRRRRGRRPVGGNGPVPETPAVVAPPAAAAPKPERTGQKSASAPRRRRRRRPAGAAPSAAHDGEPAPGQPPAPEPASSAPAAPVSGDGERGTLSRVIRRLRRT